jgi:hypothetical protein
MMSRLESAATVSRYCPAKNTSAVSTIAKVRARNGAATRPNSIAAAPSSRCSKRRATDLETAPKREASRVRMALNIAGALRTGTGNAAEILVLAKSRLPNLAENSPPQMTAVTIR